MLTAPIPALPNDPRGPILAEYGRPLLSSAGIQAPRTPKPVNGHDTGPGVGRWIWQQNGEKSHVVHFRRVIEVAPGFATVRAWISADTRYRMWINGRLASRGPADVGRDYDAGAPGPWFDDARDVTRFFHAGRNAIAVEVFSEPIVQSEGTTGRPGIKADFLIRDANEKQLIVATDKTWRCAPARDMIGWHNEDGYVIDMREESVGWRAAGFDDSQWPNAKPTADRPKTIVSELPEPLEAIVPPIGVTRISPTVRTTKDGGAAITADGAYTVCYGKVMSAYLGLHVHGHAGARLILMPNELNQPGCNRKAEIILREGEQTVELPFFDSFSVVNIEAKDVREPIEILDVRAVFTSYPVRYRGSFECSDPEWNRVWRVCRWVTQICMQTHFLDSPHHQEPISDPGDYLIESLVGFYAFGDGALARQDLRKFARILLQRNYGNFHTSYSLLWLQMLVQYAEYTGDKSLLVELAPVVSGLLDRFAGYIGANGLISEAPNYMFMDWVEIAGFNAHHPPAVIGQGYMTALYYRALADGMRVAEACGDQKRVKLCAERRDKVGKAFNRELWDAKAGLFRDGKPHQTHIAPSQWLPADTDIETHSTQVNALAAACGLAEPGRARSIMLAVLGRKDMNVQPYFMHFVFEALAATAEFQQLAAAQIDRWKIIPETQSFHEMWDTGDLSHAWNATPLVQLSERVLGVHPLQPGFRVFAIDPRPLGLEWARGEVPTPSGPIKVNWTHKAGRLNLDFTVPKGTQAEVGGKRFRAGKHTAELPAP